MSEREERESVEIPDGSPSVHRYDPIMFREGCSRRTVGISMRTESTRGIMDVREKFAALGRRMSPNRTGRMPRMIAVMGDLLDQDVDAVVGVSLTPSPGRMEMDEDLRTWAGPEIDEAVAAVRCCGIGQAFATPGFGLRALWIVHTIAPIHRNTPYPEKQRNILSSCYSASLRAAEERGAESIAFPSIGSGCHGWDGSDIARIAVEAVSMFRSGTLLDVRFVGSARREFEEHASLLRR